MDLIKDNMKLFMEYKVVNWHEHVLIDEKDGLDVKDCDMLVESACSTFMDNLVCSLPVTQGNPTPDDVKKCNDIVAIAMRRHPGMIKGLAFINPGYVKETLFEIDRCINDLGMIGVKLYNQYLISDPVVRSVIEKCINYTDEFNSSSSSSLCPLYFIDHLFNRFPDVI